MTYLTTRIGRDLERYSFARELELEAFRQPKGAQLKKDAEGLEEAAKASGNIAVGVVEGHVTVFANAQSKSDADRIKTLMTGLANRLGMNVAKLRFSIPIKPRWVSNGL